MLQFTPSSGPGFTKRQYNIDQLLLFEWVTFFVWATLAQRLISQSVTMVDCPLNKLTSVLCDLYYCCLIENTTFECYLPNCILGKSDIGKNASKKLFF